MNMIEEKVYKETSIIKDSIEEHTKLIVEVKELRSEFINLQSEVKELRSENDSLRSEVNNQKCEIDELRGIKKEIYYQKYLEKHFGASHKVVKYGTTDITTETHHIEIKNWKQYKHCAGQLSCYNHNDNKKLIAAFYGEYKDKDKVIDLFHDKGIEVWDLIKNPFGIDIEKHKLESDNNDDHIINWLEANVVYKQYGILRIKMVCELIGNSLDTKFNNNQKGEIRHKVSKWIKSKYPNVNHIFQDNYSINNTKYRGWIHLDIKEGVDMS